MRGEGAAAWRTHYEAVAALERGEDVIILSVGDPDLETPAPVIERAISQLRAGDTHYVPAPGRTAVREAIARAHADFVILFAASGEEDSNRGKRKLITAFLIDKGTPGFEVRPGYQNVSHRGYHNCILQFSDCRVPASAVLGEVHRGFEVANTWLGATRLQVAANCLGRAERALECAKQWAVDRVQFGQPIGKFQGVSFKLADMRREPGPSAGSPALAACSSASAARTSAVKGAALTASPSRCTCSSITSAVAATPGFPLRAISNAAWMRL